MTQPTPPQPESGMQLQLGAGVVQTPTGQPIVQIRVVVGPLAVMLEMPPEPAGQAVAFLGEQVEQAAVAIRRAQLGVPGLIVPTVNGHRP